MSPKKKQETTAAVAAATATTANASKDQALLQPLKKTKKAIVYVPVQTRPKQPKKPSKPAPPPVDQIQLQQPSETTSKKPKKKNNKKKQSQQIQQDNLESLFKRLGLDHALVVADAVPATAAAATVGDASTVPDADNQHDDDEEKDDPLDSSTTNAPMSGASITLAQAKIPLLEYIKRTRKLLDVEQEAQMAQLAMQQMAAVSTWGQPAPSNKHSYHKTKNNPNNNANSPLLFRLADAEDGLLGRTLLTLVAATKHQHVFKPGEPLVNAPPLPPSHKLKPHDLVQIYAGDEHQLLLPKKKQQKRQQSLPPAPPLTSGVVYHVRDNAIVVAVDDDDDQNALDHTEALDHVPLRLVKLGNETTHKRMMQALEQLRTASIARMLPHEFQSARDTFAFRFPGASLSDVCFGLREPRFFSPPPENNQKTNYSWTPISGPTLDPSQIAAIDLALRAKDVALIHGPPGTGRTTAVVELIVQELLRGHRVLATAASNVAVDNLVERVVKAVAVAGGGSANNKNNLKDARVVRLGHPAVISPNVLQSSSLDAHVRMADISGFGQFCERKRLALEEELAILKKKQASWRKRRKVLSTLSKLNREERQRLQPLALSVIRSSRVVAATLTGCMNPFLMEGQKFDVVVIDEAAQALEPACWGAMLKGKRVVLAGDHLQLPPTVISQQACALGLGVTLFERLQVMYGGVKSKCGGGGGGGLGAASSSPSSSTSSISEMLTVQYRMHNKIMEWSSKELYGGLLTAHPSVAEHTLDDLPSVKGISEVLEAAESVILASACPLSSKRTPSRPSLPVLLLVDTHKCSCFESRDKGGANSTSLKNLGEARAALEHAERLIAAGVPAESIGIITPYAAQVALLRSMRPENLAQSLEVATVDGFQGREKEAIIISAVRSSNITDRSVSMSLGFVRDKRRANVSVTRARRHCALVCDTHTLHKDPFLARLITILKNTEKKCRHASSGR